MKDRDENKLLDRLASLPPPPIPPGLEGRLLAETPAAVTSRRRWQRIFAFTSAGAIAASAVICIVWIHSESANVQVAAIPRDVAPQYVFRTTTDNNSRTLETRVCDILPPLPQ